MVATTFVTLPDRRFISVFVDLADDRPEGFDETDAIEAAILAELPIDGAVLRVSYSGTEDQHRRVDHGALAKFAADYGVERLYGGIRWIPPSVSRARVAGVDETLSPLEAVAAWCEANEPEHADALAGLARELLEATA